MTSPGTISDLERNAKTVTPEMETAQLVEMWKAFFYTYLKSLKFNPKAIESLYGWGGHGHNWELLHVENTTWKDASPREFKEEICHEMRYIYDRMCLDRLFRVHWLVNMLQITERKLSDGKRSET